MSAHEDWTGVVEAAHRLDLPEREWAQHIADVVAPWRNAGFGVLCYLFDIDGERRAGRQGVARFLRASMAAGIMLSSAATRAEEARSAVEEARPTSWAENPFAAELVAGIATPVGAVGVVLDYAVMDWLSLGCGFGTAGAGAEGACTVRLRLVLDRVTAIYLGSGVSGGPHEQYDSGKWGLLSLLNVPGEDRWPGYWRWDFAWWHNIEVGYERRMAALSFRPFLGLATILNPGDKVPGDPSMEMAHSFEPSNVLIYGGVALGITF